MFPLGALIAALVMLVIASATYFVAQRVRLPYTALLALVGIVLVPLSAVVPQLNFIRDLTLTPGLLFYVFLPTLIFESAFSMDVRRFVDDIETISVLSVVSLIVSALLIALGLYGVLALIGFPIPFPVALLFGSLISATDPVAVLALFKEYGAPRRLSMIFEGESLFNDGTAVALFLVVLGIATGGYHGFATLVSGALSFTLMIAGGIVMGLLFGGLFSKAVGYARANEFVSITLTLVMAHLTFILSDVVSETLSLAGHPIHVSAIIATTIASMVMGNYGRYKLSPRAEEFVEKFYGQLAFIANSLVFVLIGMLFIDVPVNMPILIVPVLVAVVIVAVSRAVSVYPVVGVLNKVLPAAKRVPRAWQHLLSWGSLRGALAVTMVLLIPDDLSFAGWSYALSPKEFILALTVGCIFTTLFLKATTIGTLMRRLRVDTLTPVESLGYQEALALIEHMVLSRLTTSASKGYFSDDTYQPLAREHTNRYHEACKQSQDASCDRALADRAMRIYAIGIERRHLREMYLYGEIGERVMKRLMGKLAIQLEHIESDLPVPPSVTWPDKKDVFERLARWISGWRNITPEKRIEEEYTYYRAQTIIARKVLKELAHIEHAAERRAAFSTDALHDTLRTYESFYEGARAKMERIAHEHEAFVSALLLRLARRGLFKVEENVLENLHRKGFITPKVHILLREHCEADALRDTPAAA